MNGIPEASHPLLNYTRRIKERCTIVSISTCASWKMSRKRKFRKQKDPLLTSLLFFYPNNEKQTKKKRAFKNGRLRKTFQNFPLSGIQENTRRGIQWAKSITKNCSLTNSFLLLRLRRRISFLYFSSSSSKRDVMSSSYFVTY